MSLKKWAYLAEIGSAIAVVASLIYVGYELNQNTNAVRASNWHALLDYAATADLLILENADVASVIVKAESNYDDLTEEEKLRFAMYANNIFNQWNAAYTNQQQGLMEVATWEAFDRSVITFLEIDAYRGFWDRSRIIWTSDFVAHVNGIIEQGGYR